MLYTYSNIDGKADVVAKVKENIKRIETTLKEISKITKEHDIILNSQLQQNDNFTDQIKTLQAAALTKKSGCKKCIKNKYCSC